MYTNILSKLFINGIFYINWLAFVEAGGSKLSNVLKAKEDMQKSPEQLEREKREIIASRLVALQLDGKFKDDLIAEVIFIQF